MDKISLNFLEEVFTKMAAIYSTYPEVITKVIEELQQKMAGHSGKIDFEQIEN